MTEAAVVGIFVGGRARRMGGQAKGLLEVPGSGGSIVAHLAAASRAAGLDPVLVGEASAYEGLCAEVPRIGDDPPDVGPLGGLAALLARAGTRDAIAVACDMPFVDAEVLRSIAGDHRAVPVLAVRRGDRFEPFLARYRSPEVRPVLTRALAQGDRSFQALLARLDVAALRLGEVHEKCWTDWDTPDQVERTR